MSIIDAHRSAAVRPSRGRAASPAAAAVPGPQTGNDPLPPSPTAAAGAAAPAPSRDAADEARLAALYRDHAASVLRYARRRTDPSSVDDIVAETFLVAWRRRADVPADALPWLYAVAANVLRTQHRAARRLTSLRDRIATEHGATPAPVAPGEDGAETDHALLRALASLRPIDREAILLTAWEELTAERAAAAVGCTPAAFHVRLHRARKRLAAALSRTDRVDTKGRA